MAGIKKETTDFKKGNRNGMSYMYSIRYNSDIGYNNVAVRNIPFVCNSCIEQLELPLNKIENTIIKRDTM